MSEIYVPNGCYSMDKVIEQPQIRLGLQGYGGTGKTWAALTFPNPIVLNLDRGLGAHVGRSDIIEIPFYKPEFCGTLNQLKDKLMVWLNKEARKLQPNQTLVFDGCTSLQNCYHLWFADNQSSFLTKSNKVDDFAEYQVKKKYFAEIFELFKVLRCHVVFIAHEAAQRDKSTTPGQPGEYTGKIRPLLSGQFNDELLSHMTDWFRQHATDKPDLTQEIKQTTLNAFGMTSNEFKEFCNSLPRTTLYYWELDSNNIFDGKCSSLVNFPKYMPANYSSFMKYARK